MYIKDIFKAVEFAAPQLRNKHNTNRHNHVNLFQCALFQYLKSQVTDYDWSMETMMIGGKHRDRVDIYGGLKSNSKFLRNGKYLDRIHPYSNKFYVCEKTCDDDWIIEIDALRTDQVAAKFLSRLALLGLSKKTIHYVAILYDYTQSNVSSCIKYGKYAFEVMKRINKNSTLDLIIVNQKTNSIRLVALKRPFFNVKFKGKPIATYCTMKEVAAKIVEHYIDQNANITFDELQVVFGKYVAEAVGKSRYYNTRKILNDTTFVHTFTQWKNNYGAQDNWMPFVNLCSQLDYNIEQCFK